MMAKTGTTGAEKDTNKASNAQNAERRIAAKEAKKSAGTNTLKDAMEKAGALDLDDESGHSTMEAMTERLPELAREAGTKENVETVEAVEAVKAAKIAKDVETTEATEATEITEATESVKEDETVGKEVVTEEQKESWRNLMMSYAIERTVFVDAWFEARRKGVFPDQDELSQAEYAGVLLAQTEYFWKHYCNCAIDYKIASGQDGYMVVTFQDGESTEKYEFTLKGVDQLYTAVNDRMEESAALCEQIRHDVTAGSKQWRRECAIENEVVPFAVGSVFLYWRFALKDLLNRGYQVADNLDEYGLLSVKLPSVWRKWDREQPIQIPLTACGLAILSSWCGLQEQKVVDEYNEETLAQIFIKLAGALNGSNYFGRVGQRFENQMTGRDDQLMSSSTCSSTYSLSLEGLEKFANEAGDFGCAAAVAAAKALRFEIGKLGWNWLNEDELLPIWTDLVYADTELHRKLPIVMDKNGTVRRETGAFNELLLKINRMSLKFDLADGTFREYGVGDVVELVMDIANGLMH